MTWMPYVAVHTVKPYKKKSYEARMASPYERDASFCHVIKISLYGLPYVEFLHTGCRMPGLPRAWGGPISTLNRASPYKRAGPYQPARLRIGPVRNDAIGQTNRVISYLSDSRSNGRVAVQRSPRKASDRSKRPDCPS